MDSKQGARVEKGLLLLKLYTPKGRFPNNKRQKAKQMDTKKRRGNATKLKGTVTKLTRAKQ